MICVREHHEVTGTLYYFSPDSSSIDFPIHLKKTQQNPQTLSKKLFLRVT